MSEDNKTYTITNEMQLLYQMSSDIGGLKADVTNINRHIEVLNDEEGQLASRLVKLEEKIMSEEDQRIAMNDVKKSVRNWVVGFAGVVTTIATIVSLLVTFHVFH